MNSNWLKRTALTLALGGLALTAWSQQDEDTNLSPMPNTNTNPNVVIDTDVAPQAVQDIQIDADELYGYGGLIERINDHPKMQEAGVVITDDPKKWLIRLNGEPAPADTTLADIETENIQFINVRPDAGPDPDGGTVTIETEQESLD